MKKNKFKVKSTHPFSYVVAFLRKQIHAKDTDSLVSGVRMRSVIVLTSRPLVCTFAFAD